MTSPLGPSYLLPTWRYAGDDWSGANALTYTVYSAAPAYASDGMTVTTPGTPIDLTGYIVSGLIGYRPRPVLTDGRYGTGTGTPLSGVSGSIVSAVAGTIALSVARPNTTAARQDMADWYADIGAGQTVPSGASAMLLAQPMISDPSGNLVTVGLQPIYVFGR